MQGYWKASIDGIEVARGTTPEEAQSNAVSLGHDANAVVLEFAYDTGRIGLSQIQ